MFVINASTMMFLGFVLAGGNAWALFTYFSKRGQLQKLNITPMEGPFASLLAFVGIPPVLFGDAHDLIARQQQLVARRFLAIAVVLALMTLAVFKMYASVKVLEA